MSQSTPPTPPSDAAAAVADDPLATYAGLVVTQAYLYGSPIVGMYGLLHAQVLEPTTRTAALNEFSHTTQLASAATSFIPAPNNDTVYSRAWLDLRAEPVIIDVPDTGERYYTIQVLDLFTETLDNVGTRRYGNRAGAFAFVGPSWTGELPPSVRAVRSTTPFVLAFLRILVNGETDLPAVTALQQRFTVTPLSTWLGAGTAAVHATTAGASGALPPFDVADARGFLRTLRAVLALMPVPMGETAVHAAFDVIGLGPHSADEVLDDVPAEVLDDGVARGQQIVDAAGLRFGSSVNHWRVAREGVGTYGFDFLQRAVVWSKGALANVPEESLYPSAFQDSEGRPLDGRSRYELRFPAGQLPPARAFWSLTMYIFRNGFLVDNELDRYSIGDRTAGLVRGDDGSLTIYLQQDDPGPERRPNWLPAPAEPFYVSLRLYGPSPDAITGTWSPPPIERIEEQQPARSTG